MFQCISRKEKKLLFIPVIPKECGGGLQEVKVSHVISLKLQWNSLNIYIKKVIRTKEKMWDSNDLFFFSDGKGKESV